MFLSALIMIGVGVLFLMSYAYEKEHFIFRWMMLFSTKFHFFPSARGRRYWAIFYGILAFIWGLGGIVWALVSYLSK